MSEDCLVCREHRMEVPLPGGHLEATDTVVAFHAPPWPPTSEDVYLGYLLVTSRRHVPGFAELSETEAAAVGQSIARFSRALKSLGATRVYVAVLGHGVPHLHVHLTPRWPETPDDVAWLDVGDWAGARRGDFAAATAFAEQVRDALSRGD